MKNELPVAIIGGGAVGLAAAAHLAWNQQPFILFERGNSAGANILNWGHVKVFSPWKYNIDKAAEKLLLQTGWKSPDKESLHTGKEFYDAYIAPLADHPSIKPYVFTNSTVIGVTRKGMDKMKTKSREDQPFVIQVAQGETRKSFDARAIIDASGTWHNGNPVGAAGLPSIGEEENSHKIIYHIPDLTGKHKRRYKNRSIAVVGGGHSAINTILELDKLKDEFPNTSIHWILRKEKISEVYGGKEDDALPARGALGIKIEQLINNDRLSVYPPFQVEEIRKTENALTLIGWQYGEKKALENIDEIISNTGARPDYSFLREVRVDADSTVESVPGIADLIDPNQHSCGTVRAHGELELRQKEKDLYIVGMKSYGRAPTFLMATGYEQVRSVVAALSGDWEAARRVELNLPETGVCTSEGASPCCGAEPSNIKQKTCC